MDREGWPANSHEDKSSVAYGVGAFWLSFSTIIVGLRLWTRTIIRQLGIDDWAALFTLVSILQLLIRCILSDRETAAHMGLRYKYHLEFVSFETRASLQLLTSFILSPDHFF